MSPEEHPTDKDAEAPIEAPQAIGVVSTFDPALNRRIADVIRGQMRSVAGEFTITDEGEAPQKAFTGKVDIR